MKKILVIDESQLFREYLKKTLRYYGFDVATAVSGLDGGSKIRSVNPDLIITDYQLSRKSAAEMLREKNEDPNIRHIPVIIASAKVDRDALVEIARYNVKKLLRKPINVDTLLQSVSEVMGVPISIDETPCIIETHVNEDILFIEIAQGLNREKIDLLRYKLRELLELYELKMPKVLVMMTSIEVSTTDSIKLNTLFSTILNTTGTMKKYTKVLTQSEYVREFLDNRQEYEGIEVTDSLEQAMDGLLVKKGDTQEHDRKGEGSVNFANVVQASAPKKQREESINLRFKAEQTHNFDLASLGDSIRISIVDDDEIIQELIKTAFSDTRFVIDRYNNGREFLDGVNGMNSDLVFLDLLMPEVDGFQVLQQLSERERHPPVIVLSALSKRETILQTLQLGVSSYMIKPLKPQTIRQKASEILQLNF